VESNRSPYQILREQMLLSIFHSIGSHDYFQYRLFKPNLSWDEKTRYLPSDAKATALRSLLTPDKYRCLYYNKLIFHRFFSSQGFPLATLYGVYDTVVGHVTDGRHLRNTTDLQDWIRNSGVDEFVFKPLEGSLGAMILVFAGRANDEPDTFVTLAGEKYDAAQLVAFAKRRAFLLEERIRPHPELAELIGPTLCCVRMQTIITLDGTPKIIAAVFKIQPKPIGVDHLIYGGVGAWVDLNTGVLGRGRTRFDRADTVVIPDSDVRFEGVRLPDWAAAKGLALRAAAAFPWARAIGWDIALSERGPVLIEGNDRWFTTLIQIPAPHGLMTGELQALYQALRGGNGRPRRSFLGKY